MDIAISPVRTSVHVGFLEEHASSILESVTFLVCIFLTGDNESSTPSLSSGVRLLKCTLFLWRMVFTPHVIPFYPDSALLQPRDRKIYRKAAQVATFSDDSPVCSFSGRLVAKPVRVSVPTCPLVERESGGSKVIAGAGGNKNYSEDLTLASPGLSTAPTLGWTSTIQVDC